jgi:perosamine synthetase
MTRSIAFARPVLGDEERAAAAAVLEGHVLTHGPRCKAFEEAFAEKVGSRFAFTTSNCTTALHLSLVAHGVGPGDEVIVPAMTHVATAHVVEHCGATPIFVDVERATGNIDPDAVAAAITAQTKAIMAVHFVGLPADMDRLKAVAGELPIIEDAAAALGGHIGGKQAGTFGATGCYSFYPSKIITTLEGGMLVTDDEEVAARVRKIRAFGYDRSFQDRLVPGIYDISDLGWNYRMSEAHAAVGAEQLKRLDGFIASRLANAAIIDDALSACDVVRMPGSNGNAVSNRYCFNVVLPLGKRDRDTLALALNEDGVGTSVHYPIALPLSRYYKERYGANEADFPVAHWIATHTISLPCGPHLQDGDAAFVAERFLTHYQGQ